MANSTLAALRYVLHTICVEKTDMVVSDDVVMIGKTTASARLWGWALLDITKGVASSGQNGTATRECFGTLSCLGGSFPLPRAVK
jgi:hypothetical protein